MWIALERVAIFNEIIPFRDSIYLFVKIVDSRIEESTISNREILEKLKVELIGFRTRLNMEIKDVSLTSQNQWSRQMVRTIRAKRVATRHEYKRLRGKLMIKGDQFTLR